MKIWYQLAQVFILSMKQVKSKREGFCLPHYQKKDISFYRAITGEFLRKQKRSKTKIASEFSKIVKSTSHSGLCWTGFQNGSRQKWLWWHQSAGLRNAHSIPLPGTETSCFSMTLWNYLILVHNFSMFKAYIYIYKICHLNNVINFLRPEITPVLLAAFHSTCRGQCPNQKFKNMNEGISPRINQTGAHLQVKWKGNYDPGLPLASVCSQRTDYGIQYFKLHHCVVLCFIFWALIQKTGLTYLKGLRLS